MGKSSRAKCRTTNWTEYKTALRRRGSLMVWLGPALPWQAGATGRAGRAAVFGEAAIQFCLTLKCMFGLVLRQATGLAESLPRLAHLDWKVPDYSTLSRRQKTLSIAIAACPSRGGLHLLIDSTGVKVRVMVRDFDRQVTELQVRASILNRFTRLGTPQTVRVA